MNTQLGDQVKLVNINGANLEVRERGAGDPVVFIHGAMGDECAAVVIEPRLTNSYRVIDYHRRGFGRSENPEKQVSIPQEVADLRAILDDLKVQRAHFVGQSHGGVILLQMAVDEPARVHSLTLIEPALPAIVLNAPEFQAVGAKAGALYAAGDRATALDVFGQAVGGADFRARFDQALPPGYFERWVADAETVFETGMGALSEWNFSQEDAARITQPVLNVVGADSPSYFQECFATIQAWLPQAENYIVADSPHCVLQVQSKVIAERMAAFFSRHPLPG